jgi:hypothetical protein
MGGENAIWNLVRHFYLFLKSTPPAATKEPEQAEPQVVIAEVVEN